MAKTYVSKSEGARGRTEQLNGFEMYFEEYGAGEPLVLLHGFGGCTQNWHPFIAPLAERYRLIVVDLRGHGFSTNPENTFTHRQAARDVFALLDRLDVGRFSAMGMSTGGMTLLHMATTQPERVAAMVLISATSHFPDEARAIMQRASFATMPREVQAMYRECAKRGDAQIRELIAQFNAFHDNHDDMAFTAATLATITARTLVVHGDRDRFFPAEIALDLHRSIPGAALWIIPGGEHVPIFDRDVPFTTTALRFLAAPHAA
ncbi:alpha/beta hydrolase [Opitutus sp. ER46]|uniref:alpha/beta fold hydrolase n=1 Tax=Opitutus sp. ER46 TaxID=2161864 RepID=UPI000D302D15|nr:alpha/beta hydrolase [Opitutus sp. ER46]PTX94280.1 alpha/beta hydrolase [Opitutus sp. ER46]